ncbi:hypothetical protein MMU07_04570 [Aquiflexum sp. LQ15W]|uniref:hypothetical protein n=1 Tax=Cognataquiflexum nitidum TaxID=2922272 RepID=UPI001F12E98A|nr:hypothetical protein [Cognataquiflexum nitidum]MCH6198838.1 hypothetical protein [Cognataquiflexum nitidum]
MRNREDIGTHGLQNVASNFAFDKEQAFFKKPIAIHGAAFMIGGIGGTVQKAIMGKFFDGGPYAAFGQRFVRSSLAYFGEYSVNYYYKTKMNHIKYGDYRSNKAASFLIKSWAYSWIYSFKM